MKKLLGNQHGTALISALLMMSIVTMISVAMLLRQDIEIRRTESALEQGRLVEQAAWIELWATQVLTDVFKKLTPEADYITLDQEWAQPLTEFKQEGMLLSGKIIDLQSMFNVNNITIIPPQNSEQASEQNPEQATENPAQAAGQNPTQTPTQSNNATTENPNPTAEENQPQEKPNPLDEKTPFTPAAIFARLLEQEAALKSVEAKALTESILLWMGEDVTEADNVYQQAIIPYRAAHRELISTSELLLVNGMNRDIYNSIWPFIYVLPLDPKKSSGNNIVTPINLNTTTPDILSALANIKIDEANTIIKARPYIALDEVRDQLGKIKDIKEENVALIQQMLAISSQYFLLIAQVRTDKRELVQYSILQRDQEGKVHVIKRVQGEM